MNKKIKGLNGLNNSITYIVNKYTQAEVNCYFSNEFAFYNTDDEVHFTLVETDRTARTFCNFVNRMGGECNDSWDSFTYSILHEIGHYYTLDDMNDTVYKLSHFIQTIVEKMYRKTKCEKIYCIYYYLPHEKIATEYAINFNKRLFNRMKKELKREIIKFYEKNGLTPTE